MKYIEKNKKEPQALRLFRATSGVSYDSYVDKGDVLKKALLKEQGYICAYCMKQIDYEYGSGKKMSVEHFKPQTLYPNLDLDYRNLLAVCKGSYSLDDSSNDIGSSKKHKPKKILCCDSSKGDMVLKKLNPLKKNCESLVSYIVDGRIKPTISNDFDIKDDLEKVLNLNNIVLIRARKATIDRVRKKLVKDRPIKQWNKAFLQKHLDDWTTKQNGKFKSYCMVAIWFLKSLLKKPRYK